MRECTCQVCGTLHAETDTRCMKCGHPLAAAGNDHARMRPVAMLRTAVHGLVVALKGEGEKRNTVFYKFIHPVVAFLLTFLLFGIISVLFGPENYLYRLFLSIGDPSQKYIRFLPVYLCIWSFLILIFLRLLPVLNERKGLESEIVTALPRIVKEEGVRSALAKIVASAGASRGLLGARIRSLLEELESSGNVQRGHDLFRHQSEIDSDTIAAGYSAVRAFIWSMPILGFVGTVVGISTAVGGFSNFLGGNIENMDMVKRELAQVSTGLSYAFDTTLLGLAAAVITLMMASYVQNREESFLTDLDVLCLDIVSNYQPDIPSEAVLQRIPFDALRKSTESFKEDIKGISEELSKSIQSFSDNFGMSLEHLSKLTDHMEKTADAAVKESKDVGALVGDLKAFSQVLANVIDSNNQQLREFLESFSAHLQPLQASLHANMKTLHTLQAFNPVLTELGETLNKMVPLLHNLNGPFEFRVIPSPPSVKDSPPSAQAS